MDSQVWMTVRCNYPSLTKPNQSKLFKHRTLWNSVNLHGGIMTPPDSQKNIYVLLVYAVWSTYQAASFSDAFEDALASIYLLRLTLVSSSELNNFDFLSCTTHLKMLALPLWMVVHHSCYCLWAEHEREMNMGTFIQVLRWTLSILSDVLFFLFF